MDTNYSAASLNAIVAVHNYRSLVAESSNARARCDEPCPASSV
jgi:hypothetical protein